MDFPNSKTKNINLKGKKSKQEKKPIKNEIKKEEHKEKEKEIETLKILLSENLPSPTKWDEKKIQSFGYHKALIGFLYAYFDHCPIRLSPNVIWQLIVNKFANYVNDNAEFLRNKFVNFKGKKDLIIKRPGFKDDIYKYKDDLVEEFCDQIGENVGKELVDILTPNFSTSTKETIISGKVAIMSTFKKYFNYIVSMGICGIPYIILEGNLNDWEKIVEKLKFLKKYDNGKFYTENIEKDLIEIINTKKGKINLDFWRNIIMETKETTSVMDGCIPEDVEKNMVKGWILHFYCYHNSIDKNDINTLMKEIVAAPIIIKDDCGNHNGAIFAGIRDIKQNPENFEIEPIINYNLILEGDPSFEIPKDFDLNMKTKEKGIKPYKNLFASRKDIDNKAYSNISNVHKSGGQGGSGGEGNSVEGNEDDLDAMLASLNQK